MQENIDYSSPDDGLGDKLRNAFIKVQNNFTQLFNGKVDKITGKGLSENDFTDADKAKLTGIEAGAQVNVNADFGENDPDAPGYILNRLPSMYASVGHFHFSDLTTQITPLALLPDVPKKLTNDTLGAYTELDYAPYGVSAEFWNATNNQFDFSNLSLGDSMLIRVDLTATTTSANQTVTLYLKLGIGTASEYDLLIDSFNVKTIITDLHIIKDVSFSIDNDDWNNAPAEVYILSDDDATIKVNGWYVPIVRKSVNIIDFNSDPLKLDKVTTADVDKVYIKKADGTQGMKALSELGGSLRTFICIFGINQNLAPTPIGNTQWFARGVQSGNNLTGTFTLVPGLDVTTSFSTHTVLSPCFSLPFQAKIKSVFIRGWHNGSNNLGVDFAIVKSKESGPTINGGITTVSNPLIVARENVKIWAPGAGNGFLKQFNIGSLNLSTLPLGSDIRLVFKNQNIPSAMWDTLVTVEFEEVI